ncbi:putative ester cyclase [Lentinula aff. lateritia]|uniref:Ester cyclase n=1 Tax=Lentinula aff. lateritia TaxID=2804960 RepID=A0ACC1TNT6_9AGAR|nr:putative ester cyclase [Lentinula aff. lateritia]
MDIGAQYRRYISYLNERRVHDLSDFVHEELIYNDEPMTRADYQNYIADDFARIPDLHFDIHQLIVSDNHVASRIRFNCTPEADFRGHAPNGQKISFVEHVFYQFENGKIRQVWSLLDDRAIHAQMEKEKVN